MTDITKKCPKCKEKRNRANFQSNGYCNECATEYQRLRRIDAPKLCVMCDLEKPRSAFSKKRGCNKCKECVAETTAIRQALTAEQRANHMMGLCKVMNTYLRKAWL